jgi:hypothetical protein
MMEEYKYGLAKLEINDAKWQHKLMLGVATLGWVRFEWAHARYSQIVPINWQATGYDVNYDWQNFSIDDAYNCMAKQLLDLKAEWLLIVEDDVILPPDCFLRMNKYIKEENVPIVSGLYFSKGNPSEPLMFRGRGNGCLYDWRRGDLVWCDGLPMGCLLVHSSIIKAAWDRAPEYVTPNHITTRKIFETPRAVDFTDDGFFVVRSGTQDLYFFDRLLDNDRMLIREAGWDEIADKEYPFLCDTNIFCKHIDRGSGRQYPLKKQDTYGYEVRDE